MEKAQQKKRLFGLSTCTFCSQDVTGVISAYPYLSVYNEQDHPFFKVEEAWFCLKQYNKYS